MIFTCELCDYSTSKKANYDKHILTLKHKNRTFSNAKVAKSSNCFYCEFCNFETDKKNNFDRHLLTLKHKKSKKNAKVAKSSQLDNQSDDESPVSESYVCECCNKAYDARNSLWYHKKVCPFRNNVIFSIDDVKEKLENINNQIQDLSAGTTINQNLNINVFLNETCKDAMNLTHFVDSLKITFCDLIKTTELGYVNGISDMIIKNLGTLKIEDRPIHCSDVEKLNFYIKNNDEWESDNGESVSKAIEATQKKHYIALSKWMGENPDWENDELKTEECINMIKQFSSGSVEQNSKIISNIGNAVILDNK